MKVLLVEEELTQCMKAAKERIAVNEARRSNMKDRRVDFSRSPLQIEFRSICAEVAVTKAYNGVTQALTDTVNINTPDCITPDGKVLEVKFTTYPHGRLLVHPRAFPKLQASPPDYLVLVTPSELGNGYWLKYRVAFPIFEAHYHRFQPPGANANGYAMTQAELAQLGEKL